jgi:predicted permease
MLTAFARVRPEATASKSQADLDIVAAQLAREYPADYPQAGFRAIGIPLKEELTRSFKPTLWILLGTAGFVLLIVCASIANLLLARMVRREREISVRAALGATRARLLWQLLTESLLLALAGGLLGLVLSSFTLKLLVTFTERFTARAHEIAIDLNVLFFTLGVSIVTGLIFGSVPGLSKRLDMAPALREGGRSSFASQRLRSVLIVAQVSASFMLLIAAGLTLRSLMKVQSVDPGFRTENLLTLRADMSFDRIPLTMPQPEGRRRRSVYWTEFEERLKALPGVIAVGGGGTFPLNDNSPFPNGFEREFHPIQPGSPQPQIALRLSTADYFAALGQPLVAGRTFAATDSADAPPVGIINESAARHFWGADNPIGSRIRGRSSLGFTQPGWTTIVGVVADVRQQLDRPPLDEVYVPLRQAPFFGTTWVVHSRLTIEDATRQIKAAAREHDPELPVTNFRTLAEVRSTALAPRRVVVALIGIFGLLALIVTAAGIAGVIAFSVNQRTQEFGIRMALGARRSRVLGLVIREGLGLVSIGLGIGMAGALVLTRLMGAVIFDPTIPPIAGLPGPQPLTLLVNGTPAIDAVTYTGVALTLVVVAIIACLMPARRAASVDPMVALRAH